MNRSALVITLVIGWIGSGTVFIAEETFSGVLSESICGASHQGMADKAGMTERECAFHCLLKSLAKYVLVDENKVVIPIVNHDFAGLPLRLNHPVRLSGVRTVHGIVISRIEPSLAHAHIGHVLTAWRDTPGGVGLLTVAISDAKVAEAHALLTSTATDSLAQMKLHAGHVLHALDPSIEAKGPASGYGVKKGAGGALQHIGFAASAEGASSNVKTHAAQISTSLGDVIRWTDGAIIVAQKIRSSNSVGDAATLASELLRLTTQISNGVDANNDGEIGWQTGEGGLQQARTHILLMIEGEALFVSTGF